VKGLFKCTIFGILFFLIVPLSYTLASEQGLAVKHLIDEGVRLYKRGFFDEAIYEFEKVLSIDSDNAIAKAFLQEMGVMPEQREEAMAAEVIVGEDTKELNAKIVRLNQRIKELESKLRNIYLENVMLNKAIADKETDIKYIEGELEMFRKKCGEAALDSKGKMDSLQRSLSIKEQEPDQIKDTAQIQREQLANLVKEKQVLLIVELEESLEAKESELKDVKAALQKKRQEVNKLIQEKQALIEEKRSLAEEEEEIKKVQEELVLAKEEIEDLEEKLKAKDSEIRDLKEALAAVEGKYGRRPSDFADKIEELQAKVSSRDRELLEARTILEEQSERIIELINEKEQLITEKEALVREKMAGLEEFRRGPVEPIEEITSYREMLIARGDEIQNLEFKLANVKNEYERKLANAAAKEEKLKKQIKILKSASAQQKIIDELTEEKAALLEETDALQRELAQAKEETESLAKELNLRNEELKQAKNDFMEKLKNEIVRLESEYGGLFSEAAEKIEGLEKELNESRERIAELEGELSEAPLSY